MQMNYSEALEYIHSLGVFGSVLGLERIEELTKALGNPQDDLKFIHVAGTNGKGSTCTMIAEILTTLGFKTGLYTSPFVVDFRERIQINGEYIGKEDVARLTEQVKNTKVHVTEFEFITALAFLYYKEQKCDFVVLETGLGGRFDATNVISSPLCSVITKIDYDHTAYLGDTLSQIASEKCGIIKQSLTVCYPLQENEALEVIKQKANRLILPPTDEINIIKTKSIGNTFIYKGTEYETSLSGLHQVYNAITAIETVKLLGLEADEKALQKGIKNASVPARMEIISETPLVILDGAHNPDGAKALATYMENLNGHIVAICGMMADKNCEGFLSKVLPFCRKVITVTVTENPRTESAENLAKFSQKYCGKVSAADSYSEAITEALSDINGNEALFVFGSLYLAGGIREKLISAFK